MTYKITGYFKDYHNKICKYTSEIVPHIDESIYLPHRGFYRVTNVVYNVSDDGNGYDNRVMFIDLFLEYLE